jgi:hypothetical protein
LAWSLLPSLLWDKVLRKLACRHHNHLHGAKFRHGTSLHGRIISSTRVLATLWVDGHVHGHALRPWLLCYDALLVESSHGLLILRWALHVIVGVLGPLCGHCRATGPLLVHRLEHLSVLSADSSWRLCHHEVAALHGHHLWRIATLNGSTGRRLTHRHALLRLPRSLHARLRCTHVAYRTRHCYRLSQHILI